MSEPPIRQAEPVRPQGSRSVTRASDLDAENVRDTIPGDGGGALRPGFPRMESILQSSAGPNGHAGPVPRGRRDAPGARGADGGDIRTVGSEMRSRGLGFTTPVPANGYAWWYIDALSDDHRYALTAIAFVGSVFSPYYAFARRRRPTAPQDHVAINVALYGASGTRWTMTERGREALEVSEDSFNVGPSRLAWKNDCLELDVDEISVPLPRKVRGTIRLFPEAICANEFAIDPDRLHRWRPIAPCARIEVDMQHPRLKWRGDAYLDTNRGDAPLEEGFTSWTWSRSTLADGSCAILYDRVAVDRSHGSLALLVDPSGEIRALDAPPVTRLPASRIWRIPREARSDANSGTSVVETLEDTPFYARSLLDTTLHGAHVRTVHESLSLERFTQPWVQVLLPFRMPRRP